MGLQHRLDGGEIGRDSLAYDGVEERGLVLEIKIDRGLREAGAQGHVVEPRGGETLLHEQREGGVDDLARTLGRGTALLDRSHITNLLFSKFKSSPVDLSFNINGLEWAPLPEPCPSRAIPRPGGTPVLSRSRRLAVG